MDPTVHYQGRDMQFRVIEDARDGLWRWILLDEGRAVARSLEAFGDPDSCRTSVRRVLDERDVSEEAGSGVRTGGGSARTGREPAGEESAEQYQDVGLKKNAQPVAEEGEAAPAPLPQIGR